MAFKLYNNTTGAWDTIVPGVSVSDGQFDLNMLIEARVANMIRLAQALGNVPDELDKLRQDVVQEL